MRFECNSYKIQSGFFINLKQKTKKKKKKKKKGKKKRRRRRKSDL